MTNRRKKRNERRDNPPQKIKTDPECAPKRDESAQESIGARSDGVGPSDESCSEPSLEPKHRIFLSHSGAQKDFTWQLCEDLERVQHHPFFDRRDDSLPKGEKFPPLIFNAARKCRVAVLVISEEFFTRSKWPMIELNEFVMAQGSTNPSLKFLPLFLGITMKQFHEKKRQGRWFRKWEEFACEDGRIDVKAWKEALSKIPGGINAMEYNGVAEGEVAFRKKVVKAIYKLLPPDVKYDVSHVQSLEELCEPIKKKLEEVEVSSMFKVKVVGLYGMGGVGKTTISRAICNQMLVDFSGKVCHVELGGNDHVGLKKRVLQELGDVGEEILKTDSAKLDYLLKQYMGRQEVFLVLDNVWDGQVEEALKYLGAGHHVDSMVLVTSRSLEVLKRLGIEELRCMGMPNLEEEGAMNVFLHYLGMSRESIVEKSDWAIVRRCLNECNFSRKEKATLHLSICEHAYHPLALKTLGGQLHGMEVKDWNEILEKLKVVQDKFNMLEDEVHPVFSVLRLGFDYLNKKQQDIFMDLALSWKFDSMEDSLYDAVQMEWSWLCMLHSMSEENMIANVKALQRKGLVDEVNNMTKLEYKIHDLYVEFAEVEARSRQFEERRILLEKNGSNVLQELQMYPPNGSHWPDLRRLIIIRSEVKSLNGEILHHCKNVEVLLLLNCDKLEEVDVTRMDNLKLVVVDSCREFGTLAGLETLKNLVVLRCTFVGKLFFPSKLAIPSRELVVVKLEGISGWSDGDEFPVDLSKCTKLEVVALKHKYESSNGVRFAFKDVSEFLPKSVRELRLWIPFLESSSLSALAGFTNLQVLNLCHCEGVHNLLGVGELILLQELHVRGTGISEVPSDLWKLRHLWYLDMSNCERLTSIVGIAHAMGLQIVIAYGCWSLKDVPDGLSNLQQLKVLNLGLCKSLCTLPKDYVRLACHPGSEGKVKVRVDKCWGLIQPLVQKLRVFKVSRITCEDGCNCGGESMEPWIEAKRNVDSAAYDWLRDVFNGAINSKPSPLLSDNGSNGDIDVVIRALCEHDLCGSPTTNRLVAVVQEVMLFARLESEFQIFNWWVVVAAAPCTFKVVTTVVAMEPWRKTLLHYTIEYTLPQFLEVRRVVIEYHKKMIITDDDDHGGESSSWFQEMWLYKAIVAVLQKCKEMLDNAGEQGIDPACCNEGKKFVTTVLSELEAMKSEELHCDSILKMSWDAWHERLHCYSILKMLWDAWLERDEGIFQYKDLFPNYQFECTRAIEKLFIPYDSKEADKEKYDVDEDDDPQDVLDSG